MYIISNRQRDEILKYVEAYRNSIDKNTCDTCTYNSYRMAGILIKKLSAKQPFTKEDLMKSSP